MSVEGSVVVAGRGTVACRVATAAILAIALGGPFPAIAAAGGGEAACSASLQSLIDSTPTNGTLDLATCVYREAAAVDRPMTIVGREGSGISGADVWTSWTRAGGIWTSDLVVPHAASSAPCAAGSPDCNLPAQLRMDGGALRHVQGATPAAGEFAIDGSGHVVLGSDPAGHRIEVAVRSRWLDVRSPGVTIRSVSFDMAANGPQAEDAALRVVGGDGFSLDGSTLAEAHGALLGIVGGRGIRVTGNTLRRAGQEGFGITGATDVTLSGNAITANNEAGFDPEWEAGGGKATRTTGIRFETNVVADNRGPGLWCDIGCRDAEFVGNRISGNERPGIAYEVSADGRIEDNAVWANGWGRTDWGWGAGILISSSASTTVARNTVAWNADGIVVIRQDRPDAPPDAGSAIVVSDNTVASGADPSAPYLLAWLDGGRSGSLWSAPGNAGRDNAFWAPAGADRFAWNGDITDATRFAGTDGGQGSRLLGAPELDRRLAAASVPLAPPPHPEGSPERQIERLILAGVVLTAAAGFGLAALAWELRRRRRSRGPRGAPVEADAAG